MRCPRSAAGSVRRKSSVRSCACWGSRASLGIKGEPVAIGRLERFVADYERNSGNVKVPKIAAKTGKRAAVVGAGPAGLTVAGDLIKLGHEVTVFEALQQSGGVLTYGIPEFRLPKAIVQAEVDYLGKLGVEFVMDFVVGRSSAAGPACRRL